ncbi:hypothetical protein SAMN04515666_10885 [Bosea lupini]|uniref:Short-chain dehydrogenase n=1 Tax=Bosea lupini TaxID=1036779 RepID=A0A1H7WBK6_9HYPH|nr:SDR family NAD(P)-dependent oxidoreductase [Bosea lupini]SEM18475.1 hypothetical protein SAMN04515666_10885 [Bosea lupini]
MYRHALVPGATAVVTGAASGIGLEAACQFAERGMRVALVDLDQTRLDAAIEAIRTRAAEAELAGFPVDVSNRGALQSLKQAVEARFGDVDVLMNNAAIAPKADALGTPEAWERLLAVNLWGVIFGCQVFAPAMAARGTPGLIINTGSKQGITTPPGNPAYNVSKAGVKTYTEALAHQLRNMPGASISVHLLIPGFVFTEMTGAGRAEKPNGAWTPKQTIDFMMDGIAHGDFYILCPDWDVDRALDEKRILWAAGDIVENRPALSRWHPDFAAAFAAFTKN